MSPKITRTEKSHPSANAPKCICRLFSFFGSRDTSSYIGKVKTVHAAISDHFILEFVAASSFGAKYIVFFTSTPNLFDCIQTSSQIQHQQMARTKHKNATPPKPTTVKPAHMARSFRQYRALSDPVWDDSGRKFFRVWAKF